MRGANELNVYINVYSVVDYTDRSLSLSSLLFLFQK